MIKNFQIKEHRKKDLMLILYIILAFVFTAWLCTPPGNKFLQICFWGNNTKFFIAKVQNKAELTTYKYHRNNAVYLAKMKFKNDAINEIDNAIYTVPSYVDDKTMDLLYRDSAFIKMYFNEYKSALNDFLRVKNVQFIDRLPLALLFRINGNNKLALEQCNIIANTGYKTYSGYACIADVYNNVGRPDASVKVFDLLISSSKNPRYYADRAKYKKIMGDIMGYEQDLAIAKSKLPSININDDIISQTLYPKRLNLQNWKI